MATIKSQRLVVRVYLRETWQFQGGMRMASTTSLFEPVFSLRHTIKGGVCPIYSFSVNDYWRGTTVNVSELVACLNDRLEAAKRGVSARSDTEEVLNQLDQLQLNWPTGRAPSE